MWSRWYFLLALVLEVRGGDNDYNVVHRDGSFEFGYDTPDSYHYADANRRNIVRGEFGGRNPGTGKIDTTYYTAGPRGYRPRGKNVVRKYDLSQSGPRAVGSRDDPYFDPNEDPSYNFSFKTRTYSRQENANRLGDVTGKYTYLDDVGERHNVEFIAGKKTGFHVKTPYPDSNPRSFGPLFFNGRGRPYPRGRTSIQKGLDGSYKFVSAGPDQRRSEVSDSTGHVRGSYTYLDDKGVQHSVHYIAGPETGYRVLKNVKGPHLPTIFPFSRPGIIPPDFYDYGGDTDIFDSKPHRRPVKPIINNGISGVSGGGNDDSPLLDGGIDVDEEDLNKFNDDAGKGNKYIPPAITTLRPSYGNRRPSKPSSSGGGFKPSNSGNDDAFGGIFGSSGESLGNNPGGGSRKPIDDDDGDDGSYKPQENEDGYGDGRPSQGGSTSRPSYGLDSTESSYGASNTGGGADDSYGGGAGRPSSGGRRPGSGAGRQGSGTGRPGSGAGRPSSGSGRPGGAENSYSGGGGVDGGNGRPGKPSKRPGSYGPGFDDSTFYDSDEFNTGLFGNNKASSKRPGKPVINIGIEQSSGGGASDEGSSSGGGVGKQCPKCKHTIVTNIGDTIFSVPPGASVKAHVQSIDLIPVPSKVPSPSDQYKAETRIDDTEQLNIDEDSIIGENVSDYSLESTTEVEAITNTTPTSSVSSTKATISSN